MKNRSLQRKHDHDETRRRANERYRSRQRADAQPVSTGRTDALHEVARLLDFGSTRPVMRAKSNIRYGNPRPMESAA